MADFIHDINNIHNFTEEQLAIGELAYKISKKYDGTSYADHAAISACWKEMAAAGFGGLFIPVEYGGSGLDMLTLCIAAERGFAGGCTIHNLVLDQGIVSGILRRRATSEIKDYWLPRIASGKAKFCFALTEASAGSNSPNVSTVATKRGDKWVIKGEKTYISSADSANAMMLVARTPEYNNGLTIFLVEDPGQKIEMQPTNLSMTFFETNFTLFIDDLEVGEDAVVGEPGKGLNYLFDGLNPERLLVASQAIGIARWGLGKAVAYAKERIVFDVPIGAYQAIQHPLAEAYVQIEAAWALTVLAARQYDSGKQAGNESNACKLAATDAACFTMDRALQTHGGSGYTKETMMLERFNFARFIKTAPVSREMILNHIAWSTLGLPKSY